MKNTLHECPKENIDYNAREKEEKIIFNKSLLEEKDANRVFGKDLKNSKGNCTNGPLVNQVNTQKLSNNINNKNKQNQVINQINQLQQREINNFQEVKKSQNNSDEASDSLSQVIAGNVNNTPQEVKEYKDLTLANENVIKKMNKITQVKNAELNNTLNTVYQSYSGEKLVKVGNYYIKQTSLNTSQNTINPNNSFSQRSLNDSFKGNSSFYHLMEKCDREVREDPQYVVDYVREIYSGLRETESINAPEFGYFSSFQDDINDKMRAVLVDWIIEVHQKFKLNPETLYLTVNLIDRYLSVEKILRSKLQLVGVGAMLVASKYEEIYPPEVRDFVYITDKSYTKQEILQMEYRILSSLNFDVLQVSPYTFLKRLHFVTGDSMKSFYLAQYILEFSLLEYRMLNYLPSIKAASCLYISRKFLKLSPSWPQNLILATTYQESDIKSCIRDLCKILDLIPNIKLKSCSIKFSSAKFMEVAKISMYN